MLGRTVITCIFISTLFSVSGTSYAQPCLPQSDDLAHWWEAEGTPVDTVTGVTGQTVGSVTYEAGPVGLAFRFDGSSFIQVPDSPDLTLGDSFTLATWVRIDQRTPRMPFLSHDEGPGYINKWIFWYDEYGHGGQGGGALRFHINSPTLGSQDPIHALWQPIIGQWYHVAVTKDASNYALFIDGVQVATSIHPAAIPDPAAPFMIGSAEGLHTSGAFDEAQIYRRALSEFEIEALVGSENCSLEDWPPRITSVGTIFRLAGAAPTASVIATVADREDDDRSLSVDVTSVPAGISVTAIVNDEGTISALIGADSTVASGTYSVALRVRDHLGAEAVSLLNVTVWVASGDGCHPAELRHFWTADGTTVDIVTGAPAIPRGAVEFGYGVIGDGFELPVGTDSFLEVAESSDFTLGTAFTLAAWIRIDDLETNVAPVFSQEDSPSGAGWRFTYYGSEDSEWSPGSLELHAFTGVPWKPLLSRWYHVAVTRDEDLYTFYVDGAALGAIYNDGAMPTVSAPLTIGRGFGVSFAGVIDEAQIFSRALSAAEVLAIVTSPSGVCVTATPPQIQSRASIVRKKGAAAAVSPVARVSDRQDTPETLAVWATQVPAGIVVESITNTAGRVTAGISADCDAVLGDNIVTWQVSDSAGAWSEFDLIVTVVAEDPAPSAYAFGYSTDVLTKVDLTNGTVEATLTLGGTSWSVASSPGHRYVYAGSPLGIDVIDTLNDTIVERIKAERPSTHNIDAIVELSPDGTRLYVGRGDRILVIDTTTRQPYGSVHAGCGVGYLKTSPDGGKLYVAKYQDVCSGDTQGRLLVIDTSSFMIEAEVPLGQGAAAIAVSPDGERVYVVSYATNSLYVIATDGYQVTAQIPVGMEPWGVAVSLNGEKVYVSHWLDDFVSVIDTESLAEIKRIVIGAEGGDLSVSADGSLYVGTGAGKLVEVDTAIDQVIREIPLNRELWGVALVGTHQPPTAPLLQPIIMAAGPTTFCEGGSVVLSASPAGQNYLWSNGQTGDSITVTTSGSYFATATSTTSCSSVSSAPVHVTVNPRPATPTISSTTTAGVTTLTASPAYDWLWSTGQTTQSIDVNTSGTFSVTAINSSGCSATSAPFHVTISDPEQTVLDAGDVSLSLASPQPGATLTVATIEEPENVATMPEGYFAIGDESGSAVTAYEIRMDPPVQGTVEVAFDVSWVTSLSALMSLRVLHGEINSSTGQLELIDRTVRHEWDELDPSKRRIVASVTSLSPFLIVRVKAPTIIEIAGPQAPVTRGSPVAMDASFTDPDVGDVHTAVWEWGDGTSSVGNVVEPSFGTSGELPGRVTGTHTYVAAGVYTVTLTITDNTYDGGTATRVYRYVVVYDPDNGFVTGGGWIASPAGAYSADPGIVGKANFGFVSRYERGANVPSGNTDFHFQAGSFRFRSTAYEWLVISGARAQFKGWGTVNGGGDFGFLLTAIDGERPGGGGADRFRIKIWDRVTGAVIYDNRRGASDDIQSADPQLLGGGRIVIHPK